MTSDLHCTGQACISDVGPTHLHLVRTHFFVLRRGSMSTWLTVDSRQKVDAFGIKSLPGKALLYQQILGDWRVVWLVVCHALNPPSIVHRMKLLQTRQWHIAASYQLTILFTSRRRYTAVEEAVLQCLILNAELISRSIKIKTHWKDTSESGSQQVIVLGQLPLWKWKLHNSTLGHS